MADALGIAASVASFIGFAGQILQGCQTVCTLLDDIKDASADLNSLRKDVQLFQCTLQTFLTILAETRHADIALASIKEQVTLALDYSYKAIDDVYNLIRKHGVGDVNLWRQARIAFKKDKFAKHRARLGAAGLHVIAAQVNAGIALSQGRSHQSQRTGILLSPDLPPSISAAALPAKPLGLEQISHVIRASSTMAVAMTSDSSPQAIDIPTVVRPEFEETKQLLIAHETNLRTIARTLADFSENFEGLHQAISASGNTDLAAKNDLSKQLADLPPIFNSMMEQTISEVLSRYITMSGALKIDVSAARGGVSANFNGDESSISSAAKVLSQTRYTRRFDTWFGAVVVRSLSTTYRDPICSQDDKTCWTSTDKTFRVEIVPNPSFFSLGLLLSLRRPGAVHVFPAADMRMRVYNIVPRTAPIFEACQSGAIEDVQRLFASGQASPYDRVVGLNEEQNLLDIIIERIFWEFHSNDWRSESRMPIDSQTLYQLGQLYKFLIGHGLDPGSPLSYSSQHLRLLTNCVLVCPRPYLDLCSILTEMARIIIEQSIEDPFFDIRLGDMNFWGNYMSAISPFRSLLLNQERWACETPPEENSSLSVAFYSRWFLPAIVMRDPKAEGLRARLTQLANCGDVEETSKLWGIVSIIPERLGLRSKKLRRRPEHVEIKEAANNCIMVCIEFGLRPFAVNVYESHSVQFRLYTLEEEQLRNPLLHKGWIPDIIPEWADAESTSSLAIQLFYLNVKKGSRARSLAVRKKIQYRHPSDSDWLLYLQEYDRKIWEYRLQAFEPPFWLRSDKEIESWKRQNLRLQPLTEGHTPGKHRAALVNLATLSLTVLQSII